MSTTSIELQSTGYLEFIDENGLTPKSFRAKRMHEKINFINDKTQEVLDKINIKLYRNSTIVVSQSNYIYLEAVVGEMFKLWDNMNYPFKDDILIRTSTFQKSWEFNLPKVTIDIDSVEKTAKRIREQIKKLDDPDQILLHPRPSKKSLIQNMIVARFKSLAGEISGEFGYNGVEHINELSQAKEVVIANISDTLSIHHVKGDKKNYNEELYKNFMVAARMLIPFFEDTFLINEELTKNVVFEFTIIPYQNKWYMIINDYQIL